MAIMRFSLSRLHSWVGGTLHGDGAVAVTGVAIDSRLTVEGQLFVALAGERDGNDFVEAAVANGAAGALVSRPLDLAIPTIVVPDTATALGTAAREARGELDIPIVGVTGSVGKTSTKDMIRAIFAEAGPSFASEKSLNNELGVPLTILNAQPNPQRGVIEMGARGIGHIASLCEIAAPTIGVVTVIGAAHTEVFGSLDDIARGKGELIESLPQNGTAVLNIDDPRVIAMAHRTEAAVITFGSNGDVRASEEHLDEHLRPFFTIHTPWGTAQVGLAARGKHQVANALAAAAAAGAAGVKLETIVAGLALGELSPWRMQVDTAPHGGLIINDAYNANPISMRAAIDSLAHLDRPHRIALLGEMAELSDPQEEHRKITQHRTELGVELVAVGTTQYGVTPISIEEARDRYTNPGPDTAILIKASRAAHLEALANTLLKERT